MFNGILLQAVYDRKRVSDTFLNNGAQILSRRPVQVVVVIRIYYAEITQLHISHHNLWVFENIYERQVLRNGYRSVYYIISRKISYRVVKSFVRAADNGKLVSDIGNGEIFAVICSLRKQAVSLFRFFAVGKPDKNFLCFFGKRFLFSYVIRSASDTRLAALLGYYLS